MEADTSSVWNSCAVIIPSTVKSPVKVELPEVFISNLVVLPCLSLIGMFVSATIFAAPPTTLK